MARTVAEAALVMSVARAGCLAATESGCMTPANCLLPDGLFPHRHPPTRRFPVFLPPALRSLILTVSVACSFSSLVVVEAW